jgi:hypothetical protein
MGDVTHILAQLDDGDAVASDRLLPLVYDELRKLAAARLASERPGQTLQATALVHEAYLRLVGKDANVPFNSRAHFFAAAALAMQRILVEQARRRVRSREGQEHDRVERQGSLHVQDEHGLGRGRGATGLHDRIHAAKVIDASRANPAPRRCVVFCGFWRLPVGKSPRAADLKLTKRPHSPGQNGCAIPF